MAGEQLSAVLRFLRGLTAPGGGEQATDARRAS